ncbi:MAG: hypothetical protein ABIQ56_05905 [Chitinophagaceae bacterium]
MVIITLLLQCASAQETTVVDTLFGGQKVVIAGKQYERSSLHNFLWGSHYRKEWATPVKVNSIDIAKVKGGLKPLKAGGGRQTKSLRLEDKNGKQYVLRSIDKTFGGALPEIFEGTFVERIANDQVSVAHPYSALTVPSMAEAANVYHTNPIIVFLPESPTLGEFNKRFANQLYLFEERPDGDQSDSDNFGNADDVDGTEKLLRKLTEENDHRVDQESYVRARLFDMFLSDWGRHEDQWRWASFDENGFKVYRPIPRDRDQTYTKFDGILVSAGAATPQVGYLQSFEADIKNVKTFNYQARHLDRQLANEPILPTWVKIAKELQTALTDIVIENAIKKLPPEVYPISGPEMVSKLKSRRDKLDKYAAEYYTFLAKEVEIVGTKEMELFEVSGVSPTETKVNVFRKNKEGEKKELIYTRSFTSNETNEIRLFGIDGKDEYKVYGNPGDAIKVRIIGGPGKDNYDDQAIAGSNMNIRLYDNKDN